MVATIIKCSIAWVASLCVAYMIWYITARDPKKKVE